ncbi:MULTISPECIES: efflux RND transporter periplasmic adaptor subunit [unclassified Rhizobium]|uniref:efflux RND transporter periplasmic adaptor subunit n=1 Tax=unclassified Rhizobium TaxID=2613769 RepID=UPI0010DECA5B|nr:MULTISPECIES: efflux RND transporter periplasmic adaptor subunit [unclassified Rhizobium]MBB3397010.1 RND family efflux transporter MFP subunit [Rhizobium sp. BK060]MBB4170764.1 RND family efflux transporter MFP subunit [Rhizobium sp. BK538]TCM75966.1 RND family efflux transporter MFP subunit [Rhizobium sp. BK068]
MTLVRIGTSLPFLLSISLLVGCDQRSEAGEQATPRLVKVVMAEVEQNKATSLPGVVRARIETDLAFRTLGRMVSRKVDVGDLVHKGDVLAEIDPLTLQLAVKSAEADLRNAQAQLENAATTETRKRKLMQSNAASVADHDLAEQQLKSATANAAKAAASLAKAHEQLGYAELRAEFDGVVTATSAETGQTVSAGQPVLSLARLEQRDVVVDVPEAQLSNVRQDDRFNVALQLDSKIQAIGVVREIAPQADPNTRTYRLKIAIDQAPDIFRLGAVVTATPLVGERKQAIALPLSAIRHEGGASQVWVVDRSTATVVPRAVELDGPESGARSVRVLSGLREGEAIVVAGIDELVDGQKVKLGQEQRP